MGEILIQALVGLVGVYVKRLATAEFANYVVHAVLNAAADKYPASKEAVRVLESFIDGAPLPPPEVK